MFSVVALIGILNISVGLSEGDWHRALVTVGMFFGVCVFALAQVLFVLLIRRVAWGEAAGLLAFARKIAA